MCIHVQIRKSSHTWWYVLLMCWSCGCVFVCVTIRVDELSWYFFMSFFVSVFDPIFMFFVRNLCLFFFTFFHVQGFSSSCICVSSCLDHAVSVISVDLNIRSVQCVFEFLFNVFLCGACELWWYRVGTENKS